MDVSTDAPKPAVIVDDVHVEYKVLATGKRIKGAEAQKGVLKRGRKTKSVHALKVFVHRLRGREHRRHRIQRFRQIDPHALDRRPHSHEPRDHLRVVAAGHAGRRGGPTA